MKYIKTGLSKMLTFIINCSAQVLNNKKKNLVSEGVEKFAISQTPVAIRELNSFFSPKYSVSNDRR